MLDIYDALNTVDGIDHMLVRYEQGVVLVTLRSRHHQCGDRRVTAYMDSIPLVVLSGQVASSMIGYDAFQECDMIGISRPVVKHSFLVKKTEDILQVLKRLSISPPAGDRGRWLSICPRTS